MRQQLTSSRLAQQQVGVEGVGQSLQGTEVDADVLSYGCVGAASGLHCLNALTGQSAVADQELSILASEDVVGHLSRGGCQPWMHVSEVY